MYHERQKWAFCGVHAVNNLLQRPEWDKRRFDTVCEELAPSDWINPHRSLLGVGNYDVNVLLVILERQGMTVQWHDARHDITPQLLEELCTVKEDDKQQDEGNINQPHTFGIVVNLPSTSLLARYVTKGRHWVTLLWQPQQQQWMNLDSDLKEPQIIGDMEACATLLQNWRTKYQKESCHILLVKS